MIKKITTLCFACFALTVSAQAQYNLFDAADVDADGWIWFDTQEKIDKYISQADNAAYKVDPKGKIIQLAGADFGEYVDTEAAADIVGAGTDGIIGGAGALTGAIMIAPNSGASSQNGGKVIVCLPSCVSFSLALSSDAKMFTMLMGAIDANTKLGDYDIITGKYATGIFTPLSPAGQKRWIDLEKLVGDKSPNRTLKTSEPIYASLMNMNRYPLYIHGMKVITSTPTTGINSAKADSSISFDGKTLTVSAPADLHVYSVTGQLIASDYTASMNLSNFAKGIYIVKANTGSTQETAKIAIQ